VPAPGLPVARLLRALFVGAWVVVGAVAAHAASGGGAPPMVALVPVTAAASALAWWAASRRLQVGTVLALLVLAQVAMHGLSSYLHGHAMVPGAAMLGAHLIALVVLATCLAQVDELWWAWWARASSVLQPAWRPMPVPAAAPTAATPAAPRPAAVLDHVLVRRGPPLP
jgi:hypothetical protein